MSKKALRVNYDCVPPADLCLCPQELREVIRRDGVFIEWRCGLCGQTYRCYEEAFYRRREG